MEEKKTIARCGAVVFSGQDEWLIIIFLRPAHNFLHIFCIRSYMYIFTCVLPDAGDDANMSLMYC